MVNISVSSGGGDPITTSEAKTHLRVEVADDDTYIGALITAARKWVEEMTNTALIDTVFVEKFDRFPANGGYIELTKGPVSAISSIQYIDENGTLQTWSSANYQTDLTAKPARIMPVWNAEYPSTRTELAAVRITYTAGYGSSATSVPDPIKHAVKLLVSEMYENRENTPRPERQAAKILLDNYRIQTF